MISFNYELEFALKDEVKLSRWISDVINAEGFVEGELNYIFCDDKSLHKINMDYLKHDTLTDIISFDYTVGNHIHGDIYISIDRVSYNAKKYGVDFLEELKRVMVHGILHFCGYLDKLDAEVKIMRKMEDLYLSRYN